MTGEIYPFVEMTGEIYPFVEMTGEISQFYRHKETEMTGEISQFYRHKETLRRNGLLVISYQLSSLREEIRGAK
jgi:hypothetical protein